MPKKTYLITGGAGFIGSAVVRELIQNSDHRVVNFDALTYAGNLASLASVENDPRYTFVRGDITDATRVRHTLEAHRPDIIMHLAAESHVDRSIDGPDSFIHTNVQGTFTLLEEVRRLHQSGHNVRFHHISTDEVYGDLDGPEGWFTETTPYAPSSPYSASKAASDHLVRAWHRTFGLPVVVTNCSNNYGPYHFPEKLIPLMILNALDGKPLPVYGNGQQIRDWLYVEDHARALIRVAEQGPAGDTWNIGGHNEKTNLEVVETLCAILDDLRPWPAGSYRNLIQFVPDRPGHDRRYAIDAGKIERELNWTPAETFATGLRKTVHWYLNNRDWWQPILKGTYQGERLGTIA